MLSCMYMRSESDKKSRRKTKKNAPKRKHDVVRIHTGAKSKRKEGNGGDTWIQDARQDTSQICILYRHPAIRYFPISK